MPRDAAKSSPAENSSAKKCAEETGNRVLELAYVDAFEGKQIDPLATEEAQAIGADSPLFLQPHLRLLELACPVDNLVLAVKRETPEVDIVSSPLRNAMLQIALKYRRSKERQCFSLCIATMIPSIIVDWKRKRSSY